MKSLKSKIKNVKKTCFDDDNKLIYFLGIIGTLLLAIGFFIIKLTNPQLFNLPCIFQLITGLYCPGCGGTRAAKALFHGEIIKSIKYNFFSTYIIIIYFVFMISQTISILTKGKIKGFELRPWYLYVAIFLLVVNFLLRNLLLILFEIKIG